MFGLFELIQSRLYGFLPSKLRLAILKATHRNIPESKVEVYAFSKDSKKRFQEYLAEGFELDTQYDGVSYSLVCTIRNEEKGIAAFLDSILKQLHVPSELVICDGGSTDNTINEVEKWRSKNKEFTVKVIEQAGASISLGRNTAVLQTTHEVLAFADAGTTLDKHWAKRLLAPFSVNPSTEVSMGWYKPISKNAFQKALALFLVPRLSSINPSTFLPSGRSLALKKEIYLAVGGYPEHVSFAGEDTLFDCYLKSCASKIAFVPDAYSYWTMPDGVFSAAKTIYRYSKGDGESGELWGYYLSLLRNISSLFFELFFSVVFLVLYYFSNLNWSLYFGLFFFGLYLGKGIVLFMMYQGHARAGFKELFFRGLALKLMIIAQSLGFLSGVSNREVVEQKRILKANEGHLFLFLPETLEYEPKSEMYKKVTNLLKNGWYLTLLSAQSVVEKDRPFAHPQVESFKRAEFSLDVWLDKYQEFLTLKGRKFAYLDECKDSLSEEIILKLKAIGAVDFGAS